MCSNIVTPKIINFTFTTNGKLLVLGVPLLKHITVYDIRRQSSEQRRVRHNHWLGAYSTRVPFCIVDAS